MLRWRILVSAALIPSAIGLFVLDAWLGSAAPVLFAICLLVGLGCAWELRLLLQLDGESVRFAPVAAGIVLLLLATWGPHWLPADRFRLPTLGQTFAACVMLLLVVRTVSFRRPGGQVRALAGELLVLTYAGLLLSVTAQLRWVGPGSGYLALGSLIAATKMGDVGAYTLGRLFGRRKMAPYLSPGKTWMGAFGAVLGGVLGAVVWFRAAFPLMGLSGSSHWWVWATCFGAVMGVAGLIGDLCESFIKRDVGVKDSAALLPGFGGLLDLLDSILFAGPIAVILWQASLEWLSP